MQFIIVITRTCNEIIVSDNKVRSCRESLDPSPAQEDCLCCHLFLYAWCSSFHCKISNNFSSACSHFVCNVTDDVILNNKKLHLEFNSILLNSSTITSNHVQKTSLDYCHTLRALLANLTKKYTVSQKFIHLLPAFITEQPNIVKS